MPDRRVAIATFAVFVVLLAVVLATRRSASTTVAVEATAAPTLLGLDAAGITRVEVQTNEGSLVLEKAEGAWQILSPVESAADSATIDNLLGTLGSLTIDRNLGSDLTLSEFGLDSVSTTVALTSADGQKVVIEVGNSNPDTTKLYVRVQGNDDVLLVYAYQLDRLVAMVAAPPLPPTPTPEVTTTATAQS